MNFVIFIALYAGIPLAILLIARLDLLFALSEWLSENLTVEIIRTGIWVLLLVFLLLPAAAIAYLFGDTFLSIAIDSSPSLGNTQADQRLNVIGQWVVVRLAVVIPLSWFMMRRLLLPGKHAQAFTEAFYLALVISGYVILEGLLVAIIYVMSVTYMPQLQALFTTPVLTLLAVLPWLGVLPYNQQLGSPVNWLNLKDILRVQEPVDTTLEVRETRRAEP